MYNGNSKLRGHGEVVSMTKHRQEEYVKCSQDILFFAETYYYIVDEEKGRHRIKLREYQKRMLKAFVEPPNNKRFAVVLAPRQVGKSTIATIYLTHYALFNEDKTIAMLANKEKTAHGILRKIKLAILELPLWLQQGVSEENGGWNKGTIGFEHGSRLIAGSTSSSAIRSESISLLYLDEMAHIPGNIADEFMASVYPTVSSSKKTKIIIVSTPLGLNHFYHIWRGAIETDPEKQNNYFPIRIYWNEIEGRDKKFKEDTIRDIGIQKWLQEFEGKFIGSSNTLIDPAMLERLEIKDPIELKLGDGLQIYEHPRPPEEGVLYIVGVDSAKGTGKDYSVIQVLKIIHEHEVTQVAVYTNNLIPAHDFAQVVISVTDYYNKCYAMIENNEVGGTVADTLWYEYEFDRILNCDKKGIGIRSTKTSKLAGNILLKKYIDSGWLEIHDRQTIYELSRYEEIRINIFQAPRGSNDDHVMSLLWALYFINTLFFDRKTLMVNKVDEKFRLDPQEQNGSAVIMIDEDGNDMVNDSMDNDNIEEGWGFNDGDDDGDGETGIFFE